MNIWTIIGGNARKEAQTLRFPDRPRLAEHFRGLVRIDPGKCLTCGICDYVCVSGAITVTAHALDCEWKYDPGRCTFCGRCVDHCPGEALRHEQERAPAYARPGALDTEAHVAYPLCPECGRPSLPYDERLLARAHDEISEEMRERARLCDRCRMRRSQAALRLMTINTDRKDVDGL
ncbi:MAG TPA: 4Fe-4S binding protein [Thermoleophilia bacterium]|nr:4Fe-4S binding protein [Thermoleophilia bacterium]